MTNPVDRVINSLDHWNRHGGQPVMCRMGHGAMYAAQGPEGAYQWRCRSCPTIQSVDSDTCRVAVGFSDLGPAAIVGRAEVASPGAPAPVLSASGLSQALVRRAQMGKRPIGVVPAIIALYGLAGVIVGLIIGIAVDGAGVGAVLGLLLGAVVGAVYALSMHPNRRVRVNRRILTPARFLATGALVSAAPNFRGPNLARVIQINGLGAGHPTYPGGVEVALSDGKVYPANPDQPIEVWTVR